jgi:hypothetical protein
MWLAIEFSHTASYRDSLGGLGDCAKAVPSSLRQSLLGCGICGKRNDGLLLLLQKSAISLPQHKARNDFFADFAH